MCISSTFSGMCANACTASVWKSTPCFLHTSPMAASGSMVPISLFAAMMETSTVSGRMAASIASAETMPVSSTGITVTSQPCFSSACALCRIA